MLQSSGSRCLRHWLQWRMQAAGPAAIWLHAQHDAPWRLLQRGTRLVRSLRCILVRGRLDRRCPLCSHTANGVPTRAGRLPRVCAFLLVIACVCWCFDAGWRERRRGIWEWGFFGPPRPAAPPLAPANWCHTAHDGGVAVVRGACLQRPPVPPPPPPLPPPI